ncbi:hypothetical protein M4I21_01525 [Cellulophaga sp. 20_2_10]|uniref:hypothetical protein n=1 Tax=Cellulophaga sp. 20_2_10 TaxID=2942476 RepID=UPI00201A6B45|nr:hypothetical protein [Cellulophaga sp. 20_2_10]MCL5244469.1 hypothetical protein [Cellulophaga sp. 20_2_10]
MKYKIALIALIVLNCNCKTVTCAIPINQYNLDKLTTTSVQLKEIDSDGTTLTIPANNYPIYPNCSTDISKKCFVDLLNTEVQKHFTNELAKNLDLVNGKKRTTILFELDSIGNIRNISARSPHPKLEKIGISIIENIPRMKPYLKNDKPTKLKFDFTILYVVE